MRKCVHLASAAVVLAASSLASAAAFTAGNLAIYRTGTTTASTTGAAIPVFVDEYTTAGVLVQSFALPTVAGTGATVNPLTAAANGSNDGLLTRSGDGTMLVVPGYLAPVGTASIGSTTSATYQRGVATVSYTGAINTTTTFGTSAYSGGSIRSAYTVNGSTIYASGDVSSGSNGGVYAAPLGGASVTQISTSSANTRALGAADGQLYVSSNSGSIRLGTVGSGFPTTSGQTITNLAGFPTGTVAPNQFAFADLTDTVAGVDTLYIADQGGTTRGVRKYSLVGGSWTFNSVVNSGSTNFFGLTALVNGTTINLYATSSSTTSNTAGAISQLWKLSDSAGYNASINGSLTSIVTAPTNTAFRGVAPVAVPEPTMIAFVGVGLVGLLTQRRRRTKSA